ncbi:hypothetical protein PPGU19_066480 (plasmid) [Paraburkholderia sp. PGU19]|uniref:hypothetical protein n=1 Tax=Paraburkholderia sp. PGU19 TaxID=2735434 RepID=UPI0015D9D596|nr:hypothetical protein [Paraburkholderia sp. PGU19]BCG02080.1 hypothetical protein PPGU19_066480 [Paraburkholderia sp. PGU19]
MSTVESSLAAAQLTRRTDPARVKRIADESDALAASGCQYHSVGNYYLNDKLPPRHGAL